jgi:uncharacterized protein
MLQTEDGARTLDRQECLSLLPTVPIGRLVFTVRALPAVIPVNFALDGNEIVVRTARGSSLAAAVRGAVVAFEVDEYDAQTCTGWSVTVTGRAREEDDPVQLERLARLPLVPWAGGQREHFILVPVELVTGRRVGGGPLMHSLTG